MLLIMYHNVTYSNFINKNDRYIYLLEIPFKMKYPRLFTMVYTTLRSWISRKKYQKYEVPRIERAYEKFCDLELPKKKYTAKSYPIIYTKYSNFPCLYIENQKVSLFTVKMTKGQMYRFRKYISEKKCDYDGKTYKMIHFSGFSKIYIVREI
jgi:hypothetical protein